MGKRTELESAHRPLRRPSQRRTPRRDVEDEPSVAPPPLTVAIATPARTVALTGADQRDLALSVLQAHARLVDEAARSYFDAAAGLVRDGKALPDCLKLAAWMRASWLGAGAEATGS